MKPIFSFVVLLLLSSQVIAQHIKLHPQPKQIVIQQNEVVLPTAYTLIADKNRVETAILCLSTQFPSENMNSDFTIRIGVKGDKAIKKYSRRIPRHPESYFLKITPSEIVIAASDRRGAFYGVQTLLQLIDNGSLHEMEISDYSDVRYRGVVEGFYGTPWSHSARLRQLDFYGACKMNTYIYGPKDDPYHSSPNWREAYPANEAEQIKELVRVAQTNEVNFVWAIHPGKDIKWNKEDRDNMIRKFEWMYALGVRSFAVFFDDISGDGTDPHRQAELLNFLDDRFVKVKGDVTPLVMCPTEYNRSWSNPKGGYLTTLGEKLNPSVEIMWTGDRVIATIQKEGIEWINKQIKRPAYIWWNFPVSDYVRDHLLMGEVYGNDLDIVNDLSGFVSNPMEYAEASKIAIFSVADYAWHMAAFDSLDSWNAAINKILPNDADALRCFAEHNSDLGENGHRFRRDESKNMVAIAQRMKNSLALGKYNVDDAKQLTEEFYRMQEAGGRLMVNNENRPLIEEMMPWLSQFELLGKTGVAVLDLLQAQADNDNARFMRKYKYIKALKQQSFTVDRTYNQNPYQPGVKTGTKVMQPLIDTLFTVATQRYNKQNGTNLEAISYYAPHTLNSNVAQLAYTPIQIKNNNILLSPLLEVVKWESGKHLELILDKTYQAKQLEFNFGVSTLNQWLKLEVSRDGKEWKKLELPTQGENIKINLSNQTIQSIRLINQSSKEQEIYLRKFILTIE